MPGDEGWESAKWRFRTSLFVGVTLTDHLGTTHYLFSNVLTTVTIEQFPTNHPLRHLLTPFICGAAEINRSAYLSLSNEGGVAHRTFAMTYDGVVRSVVKGVEAVPFETFEESLLRRGVDNLGSQYPYAEDGLKLVKILEQLADEYLSIYYQPDEVVKEPYIRAWWGAINKQVPNLGLGLLYSREDVVKLLTHFMFIVTGFHRQVGEIIPYTIDPCFTGTKLLTREKSQEIGDFQSYVQMMTLTISTGKKQPNMIDDFIHLMPEEKHDSAVAVFKKYQSRLKALSKEIDELNSQRSQPFQVFNPRFLTCSVSTSVF